ncbi:hypothetical protein PILCRDRAFT_529746 [Piloderma croceum F 1598]|uniref:Uncharacterized protein n=1 Tax=Piloderma croceum (strain F 1598) TaxID=765440 RepID=A0A0C3B269_PILCF|nr:hypothetical protein PILCRDRAFT_529746 [Piloderma croceum F 1598]
MFRCRTAVPQFVVDHLLDIRARFAHIRELFMMKSEQPSVEPFHSTSLENATTDLEISLYLHSYEKHLHRFMKGNDIISDPKYAEFVASNPDTTPEEHALLEDLLIRLAKLQKVMVGDARPNYATGKVTAEVMSHLWTKWTPVLGGNSRMIALWDITFLLSLRAYLDKLFRLHKQFLTLSAIATSARFTQFLDGYFEVKVVGAEQKDLVVDLSLNVIGHSFCDHHVKDADDGEVHQKIMYNISHAGSTIH